MYLSGIFLGYSTFTRAIPTATATAYSRIKFLGNCAIDNVHIVNETLTDEEIDDIDILTTPQWDDDHTIALATFEGGWGAGNIDNLNESIISWDVYRKIVGESTLTKVATVDYGTNGLIDYLTKANNTYQYEIFPVTANQIGNAILTNEILADYYGWFLIGQDDDETEYVYKFDLNLNFDGFTYSEDFTEYETFTKYNAFAKGSRDFLKGKISCIAGNLNTNDTFNQTLDVLEDMKTRIQSISTKTLKSRKGELYNVKTHNFKITPLDNRLGTQPYIIEFEFIQSED
jgi:hypothetical protein